ncbi:MAG: hypothetical protein JXA23_00055 [Bacteroidales bacterium]|nr:hypothetical protein [Bacteroidales bacterium]
MALLLGSLFLFPIGYQAIHKVLHKGFSSYDHSCCTTTGHEELTSCHAGSHDTVHQSSIPELPEHSTFTTGYTHCPVCEYTFTLTTEPEAPVFFTVVPFTLVSHTFDIPEIPYAFTGFCPSLRAPPAVSLLS